MHALNLFCHLNPWTTCKMSTFIKLVITPLRNDQFVSFFYIISRREFLLTICLTKQLIYHSFVFNNIVNPGQLLFDSRCNGTGYCWNHSKRKCLLVFCLGRCCCCYCCRVVLLLFVGLFVFIAMDIT